MSGMRIRNYLLANYTESDASFLKEHLARVPFLEFLGTSTTLEETIESLTNHYIDLVILDIDQYHQMGLDLLKYNIQLPPIIITSTSANYAVESYEIGKAADYVLKPFSFDRLLIAVNRALNQNVTKSSISGVDYIFLKMGRKIQRFDFQSIEYVEAYGIYSKVVCTKQMFVVNERIATLTRLLPQSQFIRVHKSYIINVSKITSYDRNHFHIDDEKIPIGISFRPKLEGLLRLFESV